MKKTITVVLALLMVLTLVKLPNNVYATNVKPLSEAVESEEILTLESSYTDSNIRESDYFSLNVTSRDDYQLVEANSYGNVQVTFQDVETKQIYTQELEYHADENSGSKVNIYGNINKLGFGENRQVTISAIEINQLKYTHFNELYFIYSDRVILNILSVIPADSNKSVYTENGEYSFIVTTDKTYGRTPNAILSVQDEQGHTRTVYNLESNQLSDNQYVIKYRIDENTAIKGKYTLQQLNFGDLFIDKNSELYQSLDLSKISFQVNFGNDDFTAPEFVDIKSNITNGETITGKKEIVYTFTLKNDEDINLNQSYVILSQNGHSEEFHLKSIGNHIYTLTILCDETTPSGEYRLNQLNLSDLTGNSKNYNSSDLKEQVFHVQNENEGTKTELLIEKIDRTPIDLVYLDKDNSKLQFTITYNKSISYTYLKYSIENKNYIVEGNIKDKIATYTINYDESMTLGTYDVQNLYASNGYENYSEYNNMGQLKQFAFRVVDENEPYLKSLDLAQKNTQVKPNSKLDFQLEFSKLVNRVGMRFVNKEHPDIRIQINEEDFQAVNGSIEGYISNKYGNGTYVLESIDYYSNGRNYSLYSGDGIWNTLGLNQIQFEIIGSHNDFEKPVIKSVAIDDTQSTELKTKNDQYSFIITTDQLIDNSSSISFTNQGIDGVDGWLSTNMILIDKEKFQYRVVVSLSDYSYNSIYTFSGISLWDEYGNYNYYDQYSQDASIQKLINLKLNVSAGIENSSYTLSQFKYDIEEIYSKNGKAVIEFNTDKRVEYIGFQFENITHGKYHYMSAKSLNTEKTKWQIEIDINDLLLKGHYRLQNINIQSEEGGVSYSIYQDTKGYEEVFKKCQFYIECGHEYTRPPRIKKLIADKNNTTNYNKDGEAVFYLTTSSEINIQKTNIQFALEGYNNKYVEVKYKIVKTATNAYKITCQINKKLFNGNYYIRNINLGGTYDSNTNYGIYDDAKGYYYLSGLGFLVSCGISDLEPPKLLKMYGSSHNKDIYKENGEYTYYFQFDEELSSYSNQIDLVGDNGENIWRSFVSLGNHLYAVKIYINNEDVKNDYYQFSYIKIEDAHGNIATYSIDSQEKSSLNMYENDLRNIGFTVDLPEKTIDPLKVSSLTPIDNVVFNKEGQKDIFKLVTNQEVYEQTIEFKDENGNFIYGYEISNQKVDDGYEYTYGVNISSSKQPGTYKLERVVLEYHGTSQEVDLSKFKTVQFVNNVQHYMPSVDIVSSIEFKGNMKFNSIDDQLLMDVTLTRKLNHLMPICHWNNSRDYFDATYANLINVEEKDGQYIHHYELNLNNLEGLSQYQLQEIVFEIGYQEAFTINKESQKWTDFKLDSIQVETLYEDFDPQNEKKFHVISLPENQSVYKGVGTYSYIVESEKNFVINSADIASYNGGISGLKYDIKKLADNKYQIDVPITSNMKNDIYGLRGFDYSMGEEELCYSVDYGLYFEVDCGIDDYQILEINQISEIINDKEYNASESKEISFIVKFNKGIQDIKATFTSIEDVGYYADIIKLSDQEYKVKMVVDETFSTGEYRFLALKATDEVNQVKFFELTDLDLGFTVQNSLDQHDGNLVIDVASQKTESNEELQRNEWTNEKVKLNINVQSSDDSKIEYLMSTDGKSFTEYDPKEIVENGEHKLYIKAVSGNEESNTFVVKVKVDKEQPLSDIIDISPKLRSVIQKVGRKINIKATDEISGVKSVEYKLVAKDQDEQLSPYVIGSSVNIPANFEGKLYTRITDNANNVTINSYNYEKLAKLDITLTGETSKIVDKDQLSIGVDIDSDDSIQYVGIKYNGNEYEDITNKYNRGIKIIKNGTYTVFVQTRKGSEDEAKITYNNIDANPILLTLIGNTESKVTSDLMQINFKDPNIVQSVTIQKDNEVAKDITATYQQKQNITQNGTYKVVVTTGSNQTFEESLTYKNIYVPDMTLNFEIESNSQEYLIEDTVSFIISPKNTVVSSLKVYKNDVFVTDIKDSYQEGYKVTENGNYKFELTTNDGQTKTATVKYTKIDKTQPEMTLSGNVNSTSLKDLLTINIKPDQSGIALVKIQRDGGKEELITDSFQNGYSVEANGTYTVTAVMKSGKTVSQKITYTKLTESYIHLDKTSIQLKPNESCQLTPNTNIENPQYIWKSSNTSVATVDNNGLVKAIANGETTITLQCDGYKLEVKCSVVVSDMTYMLGDVNRDGQIDVLDAQIILSYCVDNELLDDEQLKLADVSKDGQVDVLDAQLILQICVEN